MPHASRLQSCSASQEDRTNQLLISNLSKSSLIKNFSKSIIKKNHFYCFGIFDQLPIILYAVLYSLKNTVRKTNTFLLVRNVSKPVVEFLNWMPSRNEIFQMHSGLLFGRRSFHGRVISALHKKTPFSEHMIKKFRRLIIFQLNIKGLTANKMTALQHLAEELEALVILLQKTHCAATLKRLVIANFE